MHAAALTSGIASQRLTICREKCVAPGCAAAYRMQAVDDPARIPVNTNPKWPVPIEVIEWQPVYTQKVKMHHAVGSPG